MREKLATLDRELGSAAGDTGPYLTFTAGQAGEAGCERCVRELATAGRAFDGAFGNRDYERFISFFINENTTGLGADGTIGMNRDAWGRLMREYLVDESPWTLTITPIKTVVQNCTSGQILEVAHFESPAENITFIHCTCWLRDHHGEWKVVLQTEAGPLDDTDAVLARAAANTVPPAES